MSRNNKNGRHSSPSGARSFVSILFAFLLAVVFTVIGLLLMLYVVKSPQFISRVFDDHFISYTKSYIEDTATDYTMPTSIGIDVIDGVFTEEKIRQDTAEAVRALYAGESFMPDTSSIENQLTINVEAFFFNQGITGGDTDAIIESYVSEIMDLYRDAFDIPGLSALVEMGNQFGKFIWFGLGAAIIFAIILIVLILRMHRWLHRGLRFIAYATGGAFLMSLVAPAVLYFSRIYERLQITPQYFYYALMNFIRRILESFLIVAVIWLIITLLLAGIISLLRRRAIRRTRTN